MVVGIIVWAGVKQNISDTIPENTQIKCKSVEPTGFYGSAGYYLFDYNGTRYLVTQKIYDKAFDTPICK
jgi:hypothetical protein